MRALGSAPELANVNILVEIGPHSALGSSIKQIATASNFDMEYVASLTRGADAAVSLLKAVGELYLKGFDVNFELVNSVIMSTPAMLNKGRSGPRYLPDLPPYQWNCEETHWYQPRVIEELRESNHPHHDILGRRIFSLSSNVSTWKNILRQRDVPWFQDHTLGTDVVFPAAGHMSLAIEALLQQLDLGPSEARGVKFRDIDIQKALLIPDTDDGIEVHTRLETSAAGIWFKFTVGSVDNGLWTIHSTGKIRKHAEDASSQGPSSPYTASQLHHQVPAKRWYRSFHRVGFKYGPNFQTMTHVRANGKDRIAAAGIRVQTACPSIENESRYMLHPSTIDGCLHVVIASVHKGLHKEMPWGVIPLEIEEMTINFPTLPGDLSTDGQCTAWSTKAWDRYFAGNMELFGDLGKCLMNIENWKLIMYDAAVPSMLTEPGPKEPYRMVTWDPSSTANESLNTKIEGNSNVVVLHVFGGSALAGALGATLMPIGPDTTTFEKVVIDDADGSVLAAATEKSWKSIQNVLQSGKPIVWVTRGANQGKSVASGIPQGFLRAVRSEVFSSNISLIDADEEVPLEQLSALVQHRLSTDTTSGDVDFWLTEGSSVLVPRLEANNNINQLFQKEQDYTMTHLSGEESYKGKILDNGLVFETQPSISTPGLAPLEAEIEVLFSELNKDDLSARALGRAHIVTGTIVGIGSGLDASLRGNCVVAYTMKTFETRIVTSVFATIKNADLLASITASLSYLVKAVNAAGQGSTSDSVLLLPAAAPFEDAVVQLGTYLGFQVSKTPKDPDQIQRMLASPKGPNIVIAGAPTELMPEVWRAMPHQSKFVFSNVPVEALDLKPLARGVSLRLCGISVALENNPGAPAQALKKSLELLDIFPTFVPSVLDIGDLVDLHNARRIIAEKDACVWGIRHADSTIKVSVRSRLSSVWESEIRNIVLMTPCLGTEISRASSLLLR